ncbi:MAG: FAD-dependent monooxygenase [Gammaproteobacteria bacterium]|uniref:FAD-dependent monooxygenase n=1 Tax=Azohydromonas sp. TaxID=1872666 RepID=UPI002C461D65|nr:FAD-dependent monooxygenase [Azohydromonas sp.]HMM86873.1 FAD-dependent monooxygenase [Azohydromonas sp.]
MQGQSLRTPAPALRLAVIGAGPAGLALALRAAQALPAAEVTLFDARTPGHDVARDPRTLALSLGSVQLLRRLGAWPLDVAQPIAEVHVSQAPPTLELPLAGLRQAEVRIRAADEAVPMLGAVLAYGALVAPMQAAWFACAQAGPQRLHTRFGHPVRAVKPLEGDAGVEVDAGIAERFDLAVVAEGGVFADQARKAIAHDYGQTAWVGTATLEGAAPGVAFERFTREGPLALLPLPASSDGARRAALVWCVASADDPVGALDDTQRIAVINTRLPEAAGRVVALSPLKAFALGLNAERTLVHGRTVRIGNAAQTLHPVAGQGLNLGLRDAFALVHALRDLRDATGVDAALRRVEWARAPDRWSMIAATDFLARSFTWRWPGLSAARGVALAALQAAAPLKSALARQMMFGRR